MFAEYTQWRSECLSNLSYRTLKVWLAQEFADSSSSHHPFYGGSWECRRKQAGCAGAGAEEEPQSPPLRAQLSSVCLLQEPAACALGWQAASVPVLGIKGHVCLAAPAYTLSRSKPWGA